MVHNWFLLTKPPAPTNCLIKFLIAVGQANEGNVAAVLPVHPKSSDGWLCDQDSNGPVRESNHCGFFLIGRVGPADFHCVWDEFDETPTLAIEVAPYNPRLFDFVDQISRCGRAVINRGAAGSNTLLQSCSRHRE